VASYAFSFTEANVFTIPGAVHGLRTADLGYALWQLLPGSVRHSVAGQVQIDELTLDITITFAQAMTGRGVFFS
jgi:hypothetical protein